MADRAHEDRWDELALGHVLGGLPDVDASAFRGHLAGCGQCRARVAELRSLASDMAAVEREERATQRQRTRTEARQAPGGDEEPVAVEDARRQRRRALVVVAATAVLIVALAMWSAHLRTQNARLGELAEMQEQTIGALGAGSVVAATMADGITGVVAVAGDRVAWSLVGIPTPAAVERLVVWRGTVADGDVTYEQVARYLPGQLEDRRLASTVATNGATRLLMSIEPVAVPDQPAGVRILEADLTAAD